jgi:hypothetical protein
LACPASPVHYQHDPVQTTKTSVQRTRPFHCLPTNNGWRSSARWVSRATEIRQPPTRC